MYSLHAQTYQIQSLLALTKFQSLLESLARNRSIAMENPTPSENSLIDAVVFEEDKEEHVSEYFICCICLDLFYKPIVLSCGHVSCFWCVHKSMDLVQESRCPFCRHKYHHFPTICHMLHFLLLKTYPVAYKRRENQILEIETRSGFFSPELAGKHSRLFSDEGSTTNFEPEKYFLASCKSNVTSVSCSLEDKVCSDSQENQSRYILGGSGATSTSYAQMNPDQISSSDPSISDVLCSSCRNLLFRPTVLNCGHAYCETCIIVQEDETIKCQLCQCRHPGNFPKPCLEFCNFLEEKFPKEYATRKDAIKQRSLQGSMKSDEKHGWSSPSPKEALPWKSEDGLQIHAGVGCDSCGIYPIIGDRYRCKDCVEAIGFDLCGECYNTRSKLPGRFNQQHTPDHRFEHVEPLNFARNILLIASHMESGSTFSIPGAGEDPDEYAMTVEVPEPSNDGSIQVASVAGHDDDMVEDETHDEPML
ncbi:hypothetical protein Drorol1_Dr00008537 [Drosera rotundifolia]